MGWNSELRIVLLSGPICSGKSTLVSELVRCHGAQVIKTRDLILVVRPKTKTERGPLQRAGEQLDKEDGGVWVSNALARVVDQARDKSGRAFFVVDSIRIPGQAAAIRQAFGTAVHHIHLTAAPEELARRFQARSNDIAEPTTLAATKRSRTEREIEKLANVADVVVHTDRCTKDAVRVRATALLGLYPRAVTPLVDVLVGGQYGSEGKGNIVGHIAPEYRWLVRVGGPNAGHKVYAEPSPEAYFHIPSGSGRAPHAGLILGAGSVIYVPKLLDEIAQHNLGTDRLSIDPQAMIIEDADRAFETARLGVISSTAQGVGSASARKINDRGQPPPNQVRLAKDVDELRPFIRDAQELLEAAYLAGERILLEGTQGTSLSLHHGPYPFVTSRDTTVAGCLADSGIAPTRVRRVVMVCRTFPIRVAGTSGPMENEIDYDELSRRSGIDVDELKNTEKTTTTKRQRRLAEFDWVQFRRSALLNGPTDIALTFADYLSIKNRDAYRYEQLTEETVQFIDELERVGGVPVSMISTNFNWRNVIDRRSW